MENLDWNLHETSFCILYYFVEYLALYSKQISFQNHMYVNAVHVMKILNVILRNVVILRRNQELILLELFMTTKCKLNDPKIRKLFHGNHKS